MKAIAIYLRLSESDGDLGVDGKDESNSIENQRELLQGYITEREELSGETVVEYVDDGFSGTNFDRPAFKNMIEDAKKGKIQTILVKDLSRLGRDYIAAGDYIEQIFPMLGVRFIAVNNNYDSDEKITYTKGFEMAVNNLINTYYSRDLSRKIKSSVQTKWKKGISTSSHAPYGYIKSESEKGKFEIDDEAAENVRFIFNKAADGYKTREIAYMLNEKKILPPWEYLVRKNNWQPRKLVTPESERLWDCMKVTSIIRKYEYTGAMVMGRRSRNKIGGKAMHVNPVSEWTIVEDINEPIVSKELFEKANANVQVSNNRKYFIKKKYPLKGKVRCGNCRRTLTRQDNGNDSNYYCAHGNQVDKFSKCCTDHYSVDCIEKLVWRSLKEHIRILSIVGIELEVHAKKQIYADKNRRDKLLSKLEALKEQKLRQYEFYADGRITKKVYLHKRNELNIKIEILEEELDVSNQPAIDVNKDQLESVSEIKQLIKKYTEGDQIAYEAIDAFIDAVYVYDRNRVEIVFRFADELRKNMELLGQIIA